MDTLQQIIAKIEAYPFESQGGTLTLCVDWINLKAQLQAHDATVAELQEKVKFTDVILSNGGHLDLKTPSGEMVTVMEVVPLGTRATLTRLEAITKQFAEHIKKNIPECWAGPNPNETERVAVDWLAQHALREGATSPE